MAIFIPGGFYSPDVTTPGLAASSPTVKINTGSGTGDYSHTGLTYVDVDLTFLAFSAYIPTGNRLVVFVNGVMYNDSGTAGLKAWLGLYDSVPAAIIAQTYVTALAADATHGFAASIVTSILGDNKTHALKLQIHSDTSGNAVLVNGTIVPSILSWNTPSG